MSALLYEHFVRKAFGDVERGGDPAGLAEADIYNTSYDSESLNKLKMQKNIKFIKVLSFFITNNKGKVFFNLRLRNWRF